MYTKRGVVRACDEVAGVRVGRLRLLHTCVFMYTKRGVVRACDEVVGVRVPGGGRVIVASSCIGLRT